MRGLKGRVFHAGLLAAALLLPRFVIGGHPAGLPPIKFTETRLPNGLRVIIAPEHSAPVFGISVTYDVGSRNEKPGRTGFAHLFEHMMFQGSQNVGKGEHFILVLNNGGGMNGTTSEDRTNYFETLPKNQLDLALFLESDRMRALAVTQANLDNQRNAVQEERRLGIDNQPYGKTYLEREKLIYDNFAYHHEGIGSMRDLNAASLDDVRDFFRAYYAPNNAVLVLAGAVDPAEAVKKVEQYFGDIPAQPRPAAPDLFEEDHYGERRSLLRDPLARLPRLDLVHLIPSGNDPDHAALGVLSAILSAGRSSRFYQRLVKDRELATSVDAEADARMGPGLFYIEAMPRPGVEIAELEKGLLEILDEIRTSGVTRKEVEKAQRFWRRAFVQKRQKSLDMAVQLGEHAVKFGDPGLLNERFERLRRVTPEQVQAAARKYLIPTRRAVVVTLPEKKG